jgi:hypothetical protein
MTEPFLHWRTKGGDWTRKPLSQLPRETLAEIAAGKIKALNPSVDTDFIQRLGA